MSAAAAKAGARAVSVVREETPEVRITEWSFGPGSSTGHHRHEMDYVIVYLDGGCLHVVAPTDERDVEVWPGMTYFRKAGVEHDVSNRGDASIRLIEIELKRREG